MVYIKHWPEFHSMCIDLYKERPQKTRYLIKVHPSSQWLILKVTDDRQTLKYRTRSTVILNRFESFNSDMLASIAGKELPSIAAAAAAAKSAISQTVAAEINMQDGGQVQGGVAGIAGAGTSGTAGGGGGKKKKKKKGKK